jgi:hypothetical protein
LPSITAASARTSMATLSVQSAAVDHNQLQLIFADRVEPGMSEPYLCQITATINGFQCGSSHLPLGTWLSDMALRTFVEDMSALHRGQHTPAQMRSDTTGFQLSITPYNKRGYLLVEVALYYATEGLAVDEPMVDNRFAGGFVAEPAFLSNWVSEVTRLLEASKTA